MHLVGMSNSAKQVLFVPLRLSPSDVLETERKKLEILVSTKYCLLTPSIIEPVGKDGQNGILSRSITPIPSARPATPKAPHGSSNQFRSGMLTIRIFSGL